MTKTSDTIGVPMYWFWAILTLAFLQFVDITIWLVTRLPSRPQYSEVGCKQKVAYSEDWIPFKGEVHKACWLHIGDKFYEIGCAPEEK